jgi:transposase
VDLKVAVLRREVKLFWKENPRLVGRLLALIDLAKVIERHMGVTESDREQVAVRNEISLRTLYRWESAYLKGGCEALAPRSSSGRPPKPIRGWTAKRIREYRKLYGWGPEVIQAHLKLDHKISVTEHAIYTFLKAKGLTGRKKASPKKSKHTKTVRVETPGHHTQIDVKHLPRLLPNPKKCYVYNFVDHASKWAYKRAYDSYGPFETRDFMRRVLAAAPFSIARSQSDNGIEFTYKFVTNADQPRKHAMDEICEANGIRHVLIPPGEKELQGLVERSHRQDDEELYHRIKPKTLADFNQVLEAHCRWRNESRRRKSLGWISSNQFLAEHQKRGQLPSPPSQPTAEIQASDSDTEKLESTFDRAA